ncbi:hypothetical protein quinque_002271 [Culex quinquefasciatus]
MEVTKTGVQLLCSSEESFSSAVAALRGDNVQFHTYTPAAEQPVKVVLSGLSVLSAPIEQSSPKFCCYARANWPSFQREVNAMLDLLNPEVTDLNTVAEVDAAVEFLTKTLLQAEAVSVPEVQQRSYHTATIPEDTRRLIALRNMRRRQWYRRRDPIYQDIVSSLNRQIREECNRANFSKFKDTLRTLHDDRDTLWRINKALRKTTKYSPPLRQGTNIIASSSEKAQLLAASFARAHTNQIPDDPVTAAEVYNSIDFIDRTPLADNHSWLVRPKKVAQLIRRLKAKKTPGQDQLRNIVLKRLPRKAHIFIAKIFSACVRLGYFPVALLPTLSKLLERVILVRIEQHLENTRFIPDVQFGFRRGHSTNHKLVRLVKEVRANFARRKSAGMVLLDVEKAYDSMWQEAILHKMYLANFPLYILKIVRSFLQNRSYHVAVNGHVSDRHEVPFGVPQGAVLSPTLYNLFTADLAMINGGRYMNALEECLKWEKSITVTKNFMTRNEMTTNCMLDAINHLYILISKRRGGPCKYVRGDVERQLDFIKEEAGIMQEIHSIAHKKLAKDDLSLIAEKGSIKTKPIIFPAKTKGFRKIAQ